MATHDYNLANQDGASFRSDLNNALAAIVSNNSSSTAPATTFAHQIWVDTTANVIKQRNAANDAWVELWRIDGGFNAKTFSSNITLNAQSDLRFADSDSSNWVAFQAPATVASNVTWTLPSADGTADQALVTNGSGTLSWADSGGGDNITEGNTSAEVVDTGSDGHFKVITEGTEALRVTAAQRVGIGTASPAHKLVINQNNSGGIAAIHLPQDESTIQGSNSNTNIRMGGNMNVSAGGALVFETAGSEGARLDSSSRFGIGTSSPTEPLTLGFADLGSARIGFRSATYTQVAMIEGSHDSGTAEGSLRFWTRSGGTETEKMRIRADGVTTLITTAACFDVGTTQSAGTSYWLFTGRYGSTAGTPFSGTVSIIINSNGNVQNTNNSYGALSDVKLKENIVDANSQWDDIKALRPVNYNFKEGQTHTQIGLIAQEVELVSPGLVTESPDRDEDGNDLGTVTKSVNYSVLYMKSVKALQEAMTRIEALETANASLEARLTALENA